MKNLILPSDSVNESLPVDLRDTTSSSPLQLFQRKQMNIFHSSEKLQLDSSTTLYVQHWTPNTATTRAHLLIIHGYGEHSGRYHEFAQHLSNYAIATTAFDLRGHGRSSGARGHIDNFSDYLNDVERVAISLGKPTFLLGHSLGGLIALDYYRDRTPNFKGLIVTNPYLKLAMKVSWMKRTSVEILSRYLPTLRIPNGLSAKNLSHDMEIVREYDRDPLVFHTLTGNWYRESSRAQQRVCKQNQLAVPLCFVYSEGDNLVSPVASRTLAEQLESPDKTIINQGTDYHEVLNEIGRSNLFTKLTAWILERTDRN